MSPRVIAVNGIGTSSRYVVTVGLAWNVVSKKPMPRMV